MGTPILEASTEITVEIVVRLSVDCYCPLYGWPIIEAHNNSSMTLGFKA